MKPRIATEADLDELVRLERGAAHTPWTEEALRGSLRSPHTRAWLSGDPGQGYALATAVGDDGELLSIGVLPAARRAGLGTLLLGAVREWWRERSVRQAWLEVRVDNEPALALYHREGWRRSGVRRAYYRDGTDAAILELRP